MGFKVFNNGLIIQYGVVPNTSLIPGVKYNNFPISFKKLFTIVIGPREQTNIFGSTATLSFLQWYITNSCITVDTNNSSWGSQARFSTYFVAFGN